jgi:hypothetical protein
MAQETLSMKPDPTRKERGSRRKLVTLLAGAAAAALMVTMAGASAAAVTGPGARAVTPLRVTDVNPDGGSTGVPTDAAIFVDFDTRMDSDTVFENIALRKKGSRRGLGVTDVYNFPDDTWAGYPHKALQPDTVYQVVVRGGRDGVRGEDGNRLGGVDDASARFRDGDVIWSFRTAG